MIACRYGTSLLLFNSIPRDYNSLYSLVRYFTRSLLSLTRWHNITWHDIIDNIPREILYQNTPKYHSLFIEWVQNSRVCHTASIQNPLKVTIFNEFQCVTVARSLSDRFSYSPAIIDYWPQIRLLMNVKPSNLLLSAPVKIS